ncbi:MAG: hypothetical protein M3546_02750 [Actinomycetota bacterium]|nr:hypothetical protein [Actinomycetota bacterium]
MDARKLGAYLVLGLLAVAVPLAAYGCGGGDSSSAPAAAAAPPACKRSELASWQKLANEIQAPVYCPSWLPQPLVGEFGGRFFNGRSVDPDRSYLVSFVWFESGQGLVSEVHVNLRAYPGKTRIPTCEDTLTVAGKTVRKKIPCFSDRQGQKRFGGVTVAVYTANQGADTWHVLYAWRRHGTLYTLSEHVAQPYTHTQVVSHLDRMMRRLVLVSPAT